MARKAAHLSGVCGEPTPRAVIWKTIRDKRVFTTKDMPAGIKSRTLQTYLRGLERAGYIASDRRDASTRFLSVTYRLVRDAGVEVPRVTKDGKQVTQGKGREQLWRTMSRLRDFTVRDLTIYASTSDVRVSSSDTQWYIGRLVRAGYLHVVGNGSPGKPTQYRLVSSRRYGPLPPMIQRTGQVWDPNLRKVVWSPEAGLQETQKVWL